MNSPSASPADKHAFSLPVTLAVITSLTALVALALTMARLNLGANARHTDKIRADWAARAALSDATSRLLNAVTVSGAAGRVFITSQLAPPTEFAGLSPILIISGGGKIHPLISTRIEPFAADDDAAPAALFQERDGANLNRAGLIVSAAPAPDFTVKLLELKNDSGVAARYGYQILDEEARLDARLHRAADRDQYGRLPDEIAADGGLLTQAEQKLLQTFPKLPATPLAFAQALDSSGRREELKHFFGLRGADNEDVIPENMPEAGRPKYNLNDLAADSDLAPRQRAEKIAEIIDKNLPEFKKRDPSLSGESADHQRRYLNRLASSIVDYVDPDTVCTAVNDGEPAGRGLFPLVVSVAEQYLWTGGGVIQTRAYVQVWNPHTVSVSGRARIKLANRQRVTFGAGIVTPFEDYDTAADDELTVRPNEFKVIPFAPVSQTFASPTVSAGGPRWAGSPADSADQTTHEPFEFFWNGARVDMNRRAPVAPGVTTSGMVRNAKTLELGKVHYQVTSIPTYNNYNVVGDPRATYLGNYDWGATVSADTSYANSTFWNGRNPRDGVFPYTQDFVTAWASRDYIRANPAPGLAPGGINIAPDQVPSPYDAGRDAPNAPFFIRKNKMISIGELGHIFDPAQANNEGQAPRGGTPASVFVSGGGRTLRVGQPEFSHWDRDGQRALELLDIFTVNPVDADGDYPRMAGRININTAPREVLTALFYGIAIKSDEGVADAAGKLNAPKLADVIISERQKSPFKKLSDLHRVLPALNRADACQPNLGRGAADEPPLVMDRAREEAFAKFCNLVTVQSRNYRVCAVGQALAADGQVAAVTFLTAIVSLEPEKTDGEKTVFKPRIIYVYQQ
ncbi:MAG: general secretion pathway protein GspK [Verrucomicrobiales bacterium]|jgi:hypothetical protein|nr:general secretion pathway protein GspK [Verrucomicrobiales bacterium]